MKNNNWQVIAGDNREILKTYPDNHFDAVVTDPPYGIEFLGKDWDKDTGSMETWQECLRVLKPGGYLLAFSAARTYHHLATNIEMAGFEIRDQLMWLYGSGFPKAQDVGKMMDRQADKQDPNYGCNKHSGMVTEGQGRKDYRCSVCDKTVGSWVKTCENPDCGQRYNYQTEEAQRWAGWKTALKPAHEPVVMARKPMGCTTVENIRRWGVGALNIDASRIKVAEEERERFQKEWDRESIGLGRYVGLDGSEILNTGGSVRDYVPEGRFPSNVIGEIPEYQKYFYCPKVSRAERHAGFEQPNQPNQRPQGEAFGSGNLMTDALSHIPTMPTSGGNIVGPGQSQLVDREEIQANGNSHPTVKPVELMKYLVRMVTPEGGHVLDPFNGSGSTGMACVELKYRYTGCELSEDYAEIARKRIRAWERRFDQPKYNLFD